MLFLNELLLIICLLTVKWFQVFLPDTNNSIHQIFQCNINNLHAAVWFQIANNI